MIQNTIIINSGVDTSDATATVSDVLNGKTFYANGIKVTGNIPTKTESNLTSSGATVTVPAGYYASQASKSVATAAQATPSISVDSAGLITASSTQSAGYVSSGTKSATKQLATQAAQTITPGTSDKTIASGMYLTGTQTIKGDSNLVASNIKSGVSIFGVAGTAQVTTYTSCLLTVTNKCGYDVYIHYQTADGSWSSYICENRTSDVLDTFVGAWIYAQIDGVYVYLRINRGAVQIGPGQSAACYTTDSSASIYLNT